MGVPRVEVTIETEAGAPSSRSTTIEKDLVRVGSFASNDIVLADARVSRFHFTLTHDRGKWRIADAGSLNGTRIGGIAIRDADLPSPECRIEAGDSSVLVRMLPSGAATPISPQICFGTLHGRSEVMRRLFATLERIAETNASVLVEGESGTGKELVASELVRRGSRADGPFVIVDCGAISPHLIESTLFGHCRGAFTGADRDRVGAFEAASGGTVFLDEIGEMPLEMQPKLLRVLESRLVCRVGEPRHRPVDVRIIAATNRSLGREVNHGRFREDLYYRLSVVTVRVPPLRERLDDLELLVAALLESLGLNEARALFDRDALAQMAQYDWPGHVRELRNYVERAAALRHVDPTLGDAAMQPLDMSDESGRVVARVDLEVPLKSAKEQLVATFERRYIEALLMWSEGNVSRAARKAGMDRINLHRLIQRYGLRERRSMKD